jgi:Transcription factor WhiB
MLYYYGPWVESASCRNHTTADPDVWFDDPTQARGICMKCPVKDECLFTALELIQRGETVKGIWGGLSAIQLRRALENPNSIPRMRGQRSRAKNPPIFLIPLIPEPWTEECGNEPINGGGDGVGNRMNRDHSRHTNRSSHTPAASEGRQAYASDRASYMQSQLSEQLPDSLGTMTPG